MKIKEVLPHAVAINEISPLGMGTYKFGNCPVFFGKFFHFPRFKDSVRVYKNNGVIEGFKGEVYTSPMSAKDTYRRVSFKVKKGDLVWEAQTNFKQVLSEPNYMVIPIVRD